MDEKTIARFWSKVDKDGPVPSHMPHLGQCWIWTASRHESGYGAFKMSRPRRNELAYRFSWTINNGKIPAKMCVLHSCDQTACIRPSHLFLGSSLNNMRDRDRKGRLRVPRGRHVSRLIGSQVIEIRQLRTVGVTNRNIAMKFGISPISVSRIFNNRTWKS